MTELPIVPRMEDRKPLQISSHITLQTPLSRRGHGPGLILVLDHYAPLEKSDKSLDPPPLQKWAEEGFAVAQILVPAKIDEDGSEFPIEKAMEALKGCKECDSDDGFGVILYLTRIPFYVSQSLCVNTSVKALISYGGKTISSSDPGVYVPPQLIHISGRDEPRRKSFSVVPDPEPTSDSQSSAAPKSDLFTKIFRYPTAPKDSTWILPSSEEYHSPSAKLAHTRTLSFLKPLLHGPYFDLETIWDEHCKFEFEVRDVAQTMATMVAEPYVNHIPTLTGGIGQENLTQFYTKHFIFANPEDTDLELVSRTVGIDRVVDEFVCCFTHDKVVDWLLPGVPPTGKYLRIPFTSVVGMRGDRLCHEHISWDQATALKQAGLMPEWVGFPYAIDGKEAGGGKKFEVRLPVLGEETARKLVDEGSAESNLLILEAEGGKSWREVDM